ncbi:secondary thiamine-phosphate synthase enzyme [Alteribacillus persepolensis]|uniref:Secondary thiamine-phosphate synthase enzyme n=1 Tax=Alteribacillus persepolensis TaxID=568899 RepID=A0A1G8E3K9_9BACI|nr:secondary thiamine-phosphate synthase enzyme YjbQ [Alteribacillus persepolensis]SDH64421.1 secondary thiamine-phosphate synthase enzyme [Alteribacillus persepolensis]
MLRKINIETITHDAFIDVTDEVRRCMKEEGFENGIIIVYCPHTTAGITINENADPDVKRDMLMRLAEVYPWEHTHDKHAEGNTAAHLKASTVGISQTVIAANGDIILGTWQGIYFCEFDGPRNRTMYIKGMADK